MTRRAASASRMSSPNAVNAVNLRCEALKTRKRHHGGDSGTQARATAPVQPQVRQAGGQERPAEARATTPPVCGGSATRRPERGRAAPPLPPVVSAEHPLRVRPLVRELRPKLDGCIAGLGSTNVNDTGRTSLRRRASRLTLAQSWRRGSAHVHSTCSDSAELI